MRLINLIDNYHLIDNLSTGLDVSEDIEDYRRWESNSVHVSDKFVASSRMMGVRSTRHVRYKLLAFALAFLKKLYRPAGPPELELLETYY